jgi:hypothetical protein
MVPTRLIADIREHVDGFEEAAFLPEDLDAHGIPDADLPEDD